MTLPMDRILNEYLPANSSSRVIDDVMTMMNENPSEADQIADAFVNGRKETKTEIFRPHLTSYSLKPGDSISYEKHAGEKQRLHVIEGTVEVRLRVHAGDVLLIPDSIEHAIFPSGGAARAWSDYP